ncbi:N-6 DNA methylase [Latilactobacillus sakei]|uniref:N-6 DNA methylase n=1 Tax=Latilactobacillus sakei TaxID=1599 RepID=UPI0018C0E81E|nr:N-6 DNA methylase [Latilactobacillus sakei]QPG03957.1 N-6 DNA methylase [Latilactobacillus sakei]USF96558.1 hypothetical protein A4W82_06920 [Latilactobacillus sakei]
MLENRLIKSKRRVKKHGEVFTPKWIVDKMLNQDEIKPLTQSLTATFLEPAAGEGAFLIEVLHRKLKSAHLLSQTIEEYEENALIALASIYGIELLEDNVEMMVMNLDGEFNRYYYDVIREYSAKINQSVVKSARVIISANIVQGNALTKLRDNGEPIIFSEWVLLPVKRGIRKVQRIEYTFEAIIDGGDPINAQKHDVKQLDLFEFDGNFEDESSEAKFSYMPVKFTEIWRKKLIEIS